MKRRTADGSDEELAQLIRRSRVLAPDLKRHWLRVFRHLSASDRERLREVLIAEHTGGSETPPPPGTALRSEASR